jgi:hypothetical protein
LIYDVTQETDIEFIFCQSEACVLGKKKKRRERKKSHSWEEIEKEKKKEEKVMKQLNF